MKKLITLIALVLVLPASAELVPIVKFDGSTLSEADKLAAKARIADINAERVAAAKAAKVEDPEAPDAVLLPAETNADLKNGLSVYFEALLAKALKDYGKVESDKAAKASIEKLIVAARDMTPEQREAVIKAAENAAAAVTE